MATGPKIVETPLELLENDGTREPPLLSKIWAPTICGAVGFIAVIVGNWASRRPYFSGIQKHVLWAAGGAGTGKVIDDFRNEYLADRDAVYRHYIQLHPEDFPPYGNKDLLLSTVEFHGPLSNNDYLLIAKHFKNQSEDF